MKFAFLLPLFCCLLPIAGCAKGGGPSAGRTANRLEASLSIRTLPAGTNAIDPNAYYAVAFDDVPGGDGPGAIIGNTPILNGIVAGNFRVAVIYHANQFEIYYRSNPSDFTTERRILSSTDPLFPVVPRATSTGINFTLNLDARLETGAGGTTYFFPRAADGTTLNLDRIDLNFVTSNVIIRDANDNRIKPVDAVGFRTVSPSSAVTNFLVRTTRNTTISDDVDDALPYDASFRGFNFNAIDVASLQINVTRNNG